MFGKVKNLKCYERSEISIIDFLYTYCGITTNNLFRITHKDVKRLLPDLKRCSILDTSKNMGLVYDGTILLVKDSKGSVLPYLNPLRCNYNEVEDYGELEEPEHREFTKNEFDPSCFTNYELKLNYKLQKNSKNVGKYKICRLIKRELDNRGIKGPGRKRILIDRIKGEVNND